MVCANAALIGFVNVFFNQRGMRPGRNCNEVGSTVSDRYVLPLKGECGALDDELEDELEEGSLEEDELEDDEEDGVSSLKADC
jgi:hypothetical protein